MKTVLTIAGSDCSGGAGIQADIKTIAAHRLFATSVITAVTAQNTLGVQSVFALSTEAVSAQLDSVFSDIVPDAVKIGMLYSAEIVAVVAQKLKQYGAPHIVIDPVLLSTSGRRLLSEDAVFVLTERLFPLAELITPNLPETTMLRGALLQTNCAVLVKGGHDQRTADDVLYASGHFLDWPDKTDGVCRFCGTRSKNPNTHGTGCTLSSAIACGLAQGQSLADSVALAKQYITGAIRAGLSIGHGRGPLDHFWNIKKN